MKKLDSCANIERIVLDTLDGLVDKSTAWDKGRPDEVESFKDEVMTHGLTVQDERCVWCTLLVGSAGRRRADRDHIAPKKKYPQWTFNPRNIAISCEFCNGFSVKSDVDTVRTVAACYDACEFHLVHPYLVDNVANHLGFMLTNNGTPGVSIQGLSEQGRWTIEKLKLDDPGMTVQRAMDYFYLQTMNNLPPYFQNLFSKATGRECVPAEFADPR